MTKSIISAHDGAMHNDKIIKATILDIYNDDMQNKEFVCLADYFNSIVSNSRF